MNFTKVLISYLERSGLVVSKAGNILTVGSYVIYVDNSGRSAILFEERGNYLRKLFLAEYSEDVTVDTCPITAVLRHNAV